MKFKKIIAALLCAAQLLSVGVAFAEETAATEEAQVTETPAMTEEATAEDLPETEIPLGENEIRVFISTDGSDSNSGSFDSPVATLDKGIALGLQAKSTNPGKTVTVNIRGGEYKVNKSTKLNAQHSGTEANPFVIQAYNGEEVVITGSITLTPQKFKGVSDEETLARIPTEAHGYVGVYDLSKDMNIVEAYNSNSEMGGNKTGYYELSVDGKYQTLARWPNEGWDTAKSVGTMATSLTGQNSGGRVSRWKTATNASLCGYFGVEYAYSDIAITGVSGQEIQVASKPYYGMSLGNRYWVKNLLEELDIPGEWYIDAKAKKLYFYPPYDIADATIELSVMSDAIFTADGLENVTFRGLTVKGTRGHAFNLPNSKNVVIEDCTIENIGHKGIIMTDSSNCKIQNNIITHIGSNAIVISGGDRTTLTPANHLIDNNHIYDFAYLYRSNNQGIDLGGVGTTITNNLIHSSPSQAIMYSGNDHKMLYNEFYDLVNEPVDAGAIYMGRNYTYRGHEIAYNYFHDLPTPVKGGSIFVCGVYLDDMCSSADIHHNVFYKCNLGVMIGGGKDSKFDNNLILECEQAMFMDARGVGWAAYHAAKDGQAYKTLFQIPYTKEPWISRFPEINAAVEDIDNLGLPTGNSIQDNLMQGCGVNMIAPEFATYGTVDNNVMDKLVDTDSYEDYENRNFNIKQSSEIAKKFPELCNIDMNKIGLREDMQTKVKERANNESLKLIKPWNGATGITNLGYSFSWDDHSTASKYIVKIAEDPEMQNVILTHESSDSLAEIQFIPSGGKPYWWTVEGVNETQSMQATYTQLGAPRLFTSTLYEQTEKKELRANITTLTTLEAAVREGTTPGTYKKGFKERVTQLKMEMEAANNSGTVLQVEINALNERYDELIGSIKDNINYDVVNVGELLKDQARWVYEEGCYTFKDDGSLELQGPDGKMINHYKNMIYDEPLGDNVAIKFGYKVDIGSNYCMVGLQNDATFLNGGYDLIIKSNQIEIQKRITGTTGDAIKSTALNFYISEGKWVDLELGALKTGIGTYVYLVADGYMIDSFLDTEAPIWTGESKFVFGNTNGTGLAAIRPAQD